MTTLEIDMETKPFASEPDFENLDCSLSEGRDSSAHEEINDRRARLESAETMRLVRAL